MIDFHSHIDLYPDPRLVVEKCGAMGIYVLSVTTTPSAWHGTRALAEGFPRIRTALGLHPQIAHQRKHELTLFDQHLPETRYVGEVGLDGSPELKVHWPDQVEVFEHILRACSNVGGRVLSIHSRRATSAVLDQIECHPDAGKFVLHWFSGTQRELARSIELGCWFSVGPSMLTGERGRALTRRMPRDRVLTETDGPFARIEDRPADPWDVGLAIEMLGRTWEVAPDEVSAVLRANLGNLASEG